MLFFEKNKFWLKCVPSVWGVLALVFSFYMTTFFFGNHDYRFMRYGLSLMSGAWEGRFTQFILPYVLFDGQVLPIINVYIGFAFFAAAVVLLAWWYALREKYLTVVLFGLIIVLNPYILSQLYYVHSIVSILAWPLFGVAGVMLVDAGLVEKRKWLLSGGVLCLLICFFGYGGTLELVLTILGGKVLIDTVRSEERFCLVVKRYFPTGIVLLLVILLFALVMEYIKARHWVNTGMYNVQTLSAMEVLQKFGQRYILTWKVLFTPPPYCSMIVSGCVAGLMTMLLLEVQAQRRFLLMCCMLMVWVCVIFLLAFISPYDFFMTFRIHFFSVPYFAAVLYAMVLQSKRIVLRNMAFVFGGILVLCYLQANFMAQKVWNLGYRQNEAVAERMRQDILPKLPKGKHYRAAIVGGFYGNEKFAGVDKLTEENREFYREVYGYPLYLNVFFSGGFFLYESINPIWGDGLFLNRRIFYNFYNEMTDKNDLLSAQIFMQSFGDDKAEQKKAAAQIKPWPHPDYYFIGQKDIFLMLSEDIFNKKVLQREIRKKRRF